MPNDFPTAPECVIPVQPAICPHSKVPLEINANLNRRAHMIEWAERNPAKVVAEIEECRNNLLYFLNTYGWTQQFFEVTKDGVSRTRQNKLQPFLLWPAQAELASRIEKCIKEGDSLLLEKSREVGASWLVLVIFAHQFLFSKAPVQFSLLSQKEADVDDLSGDVHDYPWGTISNPSTLFGKLDFFLQNLPKWMLPQMYRKRMQIVNTLNRSRIDGSSSGSFALSSQRRDAILVDEAAKVESFKSIWQSITDVSKCRLAVSTPIGMGSFFTELRNSGTVTVVDLPWYKDPSKARDLSVEKLPDGHYRFTSNWYRRETSVRTKVDIAQNIDIAHLESGTTFFNTMALKKYVADNCVPPMLRLSIKFDDGVADASIPGILAVKDASKVRVREDPKGPWKLWFRPASTPTYETKDGDFEYVPAAGHLIFGIDVSMGVGASNSVMSVVNKLSRAKIAEFADANVPPHELAKLACAAALWFGQMARPLLVPEANGLAGFDFLRQISKVYRYANLYCEKTDFNKGDKTTTSYGFHSSRPKKAILLGNLSRAYNMGNFLNPSEEAVKEAMQYVIFESGEIGPAYLMRESPDAKQTHGDRCIADCLAIWPGSEQQAYREEKRLAKEGTDTGKIDFNAKYPYMSLGWRMQNKDTVYKDRPKKSLRDLRPGDRFNVQDYI